MKRCLWVMVVAGAALAQEAPPPDWSESLAGAREAFSRLNYGEAAGKAEAAVSTAGDDAGKLEAVRLLASIQRAQGDYAAAARSLTRAIDFCVSVHGAGSPQAAALFADLASAERVQGRWEEALAAIQKAIGIRESGAGMRPEDLARDLTTAANIQIKLDRPKDARDALTRAIDLWNTSSPGDPLVLPALEALANLHRNASEYLEAEPLLVRALKFRESLTGPDGPEVIALVDSLAYIYFGMHRFAEAEANYKRLLDLWEKSAGAEHPMRALTLDKMAEFYAYQQRYEEARKAAAEALAMRTRMHVAGLNQTGRLLLMEARIDDAEDLYRRAVQIGDLAKIPDDAMDPLLRVYAGVLRVQKKTDEAQAVEARVKEALLRKADREGRRPSPVKLPAPARP
jgi:tetratricopeptide (TPR) repeat protein